MPRWVNILIQVTAILVQAGDWSGYLVPKEYKEGVSLAIAVIQAGTGVIAHHYNVDGEPQTVAYRPKGAL